MRYATVRLPGGSTAAVELGATSAAVFDAVDVGELLSRRGQGDTVERTDDVDLEGLDLAPVVTRPGKIFCAGVNYKSHIEEMGEEQPDFPTLFAKFADSLIGAYDDIVLPASSKSVDWEAELTVVIGTSIRHGSRSDAQRAIAGYTVANDISVRDVQFRTKQWLQGKTFEATNPLGPYLVSGDEIGDAKDLLMTCELNGDVVQKARTSDLLFDAADLVAYISQITTLRPGDVVLTGTPSGVGFARNPPRFLSADDVLTTTIEGIGSMTNRCVVGAD